MYLLVANHDSVWSVEPRNGIEKVGVSGWGFGSATGRLIADSVAEAPDGMGDGEEDESSGAFAEAAGLAELSPSFDSDCAAEIMAGALIE